MRDLLYTEYDKKSQITRKNFRANFGDHFGAAPGRRPLLERLLLPPSPTASSDMPRKRARATESVVVKPESVADEAAVATKRSTKSRRKQAASPPSATGAGPFPTHRSPSEAEARAVHQALSLLHPEVIEELSKPKQEEGGCGSRHLVLDALVGTILSQNTTDVQSHRSFAALKQAFPTWEMVRTSPPAAIEAVIKSCGLAETKTARVQVILQLLHDERGECSLEHLREASDEVVKRVLGSYKGVGAKTISCVLMFCLKRFDFPVDTHVWKIALALNWVPKAATRDQTYEHLNAKVPDEIKYALHVLLVKHGKVYKNDVKTLRETLRHCEAGGEELPGEDAPPSEPTAVKQEVKPEAVD